MHALHTYSHKNAHHQTKNCLNAMVAYADEVKNVLRRPAQAI